MIPLLKQYKRVLAWFVAGLVFVVLWSFGISGQQPVTAFTQSNTPALASSTQVQTLQPSAIDTYAGESFASTHLEPNFYQ